MADQDTWRETMLAEAGIPVNAWRPSMSGAFRHQTDQVRWFVRPWETGARVSVLLRCTGISQVHDGVIWRRFAHTVRVMKAATDVALAVE